MRGWLGVVFRDSPLGIISSCWSPVCMERGNSSVVEITPKESMHKIIVQLRPGHKLIITIKGPVPWCPISCSYLRPAYCRKCCEFIHELVQKFSAFNAPLWENIFILKSLRIKKRKILFFIYLFNMIFIYILIKVICMT